MGTDENDSLSRQEVEAALNFSEADWVRARRLARVWAHNLIGWTEDDLLQEALTVLLAGTRTWPRHLPFTVVVSGVMRSIASNARESSDYRHVDPYVSVGSRDAEEVMDVAISVVEAHDNITPEDSTEHGQTLARIEKLVENDNDAYLVMLAWAEGATHDEAMRAAGLDANAYGAARKRLDRKLANLK
jgi:hypothetical protein